MTSSSRDALPVPDEAWNALLLELAEHHGIHDQGCVRDVAAPVVAAELRRMAEAIRDDIGNAVRQLGPSEADQGGLDAADMLDTRADELDPQKTEARDG